MSSSLRVGFGYRDIRTNEHLVVPTDDLESKELHQLIDMFFVFATSGIEMDTAELICVKLQYL